jgi:hypothetical protein
MFSSSAINGFCSGTLLSLMALEVRLWTDPIQVVSFSFRSFGFIAGQIVILFGIGRNRTGEH